MHQENILHSQSQESSSFITCLVEMDEQHNPSRLQEFQTAFILQLLANGSQQSRQEEDTARVVPPRNGSSISGAPATCITNLEATDSDPTTTRSRNGTMTRAQVAPPHVPPARSRAVSPPPAVAAGAGDAANSSHPLAKLEHVTSSTADDSNNNCVTSLTFLPIRPLHAPPKLQRFPLSTATNDNALLSNKICSENTTSTPCSRSVLGPIFPCRARAAADTDGIKNRGQFSSIAIIPRGRAISINEMTCMDHSDNNKSYPRIDNVQQSDHGDSTNNCIITGLPRQNICKMEGCPRETMRRSVYCPLHFGQRRCDFQKCQKFAQGRTRFCIAHGGGRRCKVNGCSKAARDRWFCAAHGGGKRCEVGSCNRLAVGRGTMCTWHRKNQICPNTAREDQQSLQPTLRCDEQEKPEETASSVSGVLCTVVSKDFCCKR